MTATNVQQQILLTDVMYPSGLQCAVMFVQAKSRERERNPLRRMVSKADSSTCTKRIYMCAYMWGDARTDSGTIPGPQAPSQTPQSEGQQASCAPKSHLSTEPQCLGTTGEVREHVGDEGNDLR